MPASASSPLRRAALAVAALAVLAVGASSFERLFADGLPAPMDFAAFWTAGAIGLAGGNVYDGAAVREVQSGIGLNTTAIMMWNPPWALTLVLPIGWLPFKTAYAIWVLMNIGLLIASADLLWRGLGGSRRFRGIALLLTLAFAPTLLLIFSGQLTAFVLLGLAGFLVLRPRHPFLAGMAGAITAIKPHMLVLFALWLLFDACRNRDGRKVLLGGVASLLLLSAIPTALDPGIWPHYAAVTTGASSTDHEHVSSWSPPLIGWWLRMAVPGQPFWVQWLPLAIGVAVFVAWRCREALKLPTLPAGARSPFRCECIGTAGERRDDVTPEPPNTPPPGSGTQGRSRATLSQRGEGVDPRSRRLLHAHRTIRRVDARSRADDAADPGGGGEVDAAAEPCRDRFRRLLLRSRRCIALRHDRGEVPV
ncbi:MAG: glycosyltransferase family 87 protein [Gemmataceae bacterium]